MNLRKNFNSDIYSDIYISNANNDKIDIVILCGGLGNRLRSIISDKPKVLAKIGNELFLDILINNILQYGFKNIILCVGYLKEQIKDHYSNCFDCRNTCNIMYSEEEKPLGTGGALKNAVPLINSDHFIVMNGDSICDIDLKEFYNFHIKKDALLSIVLSKSCLDQSNKDYGTVKLNNLQKIISFNEKSSDNIDNDNNIDNVQSLINAGTYIMKRDIFHFIPERDNFSLEYDLFPKIIKLSNVYGFITENNIIDIGTPERYNKAISILSNWQKYVN